MFVSHKELTVTGELYLLEQIGHVIMSFTSSILKDILYLKQKIQF